MTSEQHRPVRCQVLGGGRYVTIQLVQLEERIIVGRVGCGRLRLDLDQTLLGCVDLRLLALVETCWCLSPSGKPGRK